MSNFGQLTKKAFENYHNTPYEGAVWSLTDAIGHIMQFLEHHDSIDEMPGLREALRSLSTNEWEIWRERYPEDVERVIAPLQREFAGPAH
jgi:hypothetical protein